MIISILDINDTTELPVIYAEAKANLAQAVQVADRFHILKNLREYLEDYCTRKQFWQHPYDL